MASHAEQQVRQKLVDVFANYFCTFLAKCKTNSGALGEDASNSFHETSRGLQHAVPGEHRTTEFLTVVSGNMACLIHTVDFSGDAFDAALFGL
jgi:hypothetical protein